MGDITYSVEVDSLSKTEWDEQLDRFSDANIYQTWAFGLVSWSERCVSRLVLRADGEIVAMAQLQIRKLPLLKAGVAQLRWGPVFQIKGIGASEAVVERMAIALRDEYVRKRSLFLRVIPPACKESAEEMMLKKSFSTYKDAPFRERESKRTMILDISRPIDDIRASLDRKWRNHLNRAERNGLTISSGREPEKFNAFEAIYREMLGRKGFEDSSSVSDYERMQQIDGGKKLIVFICSDDGRPAAGLIGTAVGNTGIYLMGATNEIGMKCKGAFAIQWRMIQWLKEKGVSYYNLGGINPDKNPGVYNFKRGFGGDDLKYMNPLVAVSNVQSRMLGRIAFG